MKFFSRISLPETIPSPIGDGTQFRYVERYEDGKRIFEKAGQEDIKAYIEASKEASLVSNIIKRFENGDIDALNARRGIYGDSSLLPSTPQEAHNMLRYAAEKFNSLPESVRSNFEDFNDYVKKANTLNVDEFVKLVTPTPLNLYADVNEKEDTSNESK